MAHARPAGSGSVKDSPLAVPCPLLARVSLKPTWSPALSPLSLHDALPFLLAQLTSTKADALSWPSLAVLTLAVLVIRPQSSLVVVATTWTLVLAPAARLVGA